MLWFISAGESQIKPEKLLKVKKFKYELKKYNAVWTKNKHYLDKNKLNIFYFIYIYFVVIQIPQKHNMSINRTVCRVSILTTVRSFISYNKIKIEKNK